MKKVINIYKQHDYIAALETILLLLGETDLYLNLIKKNIFRDNMTHLTEGLSLKKFRMSKLLTYRMLSFTESSGRLEILKKYIYMDS